MRVVAVIQARMGSSRLPGKVLLPIAGKPLLWHIVHRLRKARTVDTIVVATSKGAIDDPIAEFAKDAGIHVVRGEEDDVLGRFALAADRLDPDIVLRVVGDAPLIDPGFIDRIVTEMWEARADFVMLEEGRVTIHEGVDPMSARALRHLLETAREDPVAREHVTGYFKAHPEAVKIHRTAPEPGHELQGARITVDTPADIAFLDLVHQRLCVPAGEAALADVVRLLKAEPRLMRVNADVRQKGVFDRSGVVLVRCDGGGRIGLGHVTRCLAIAEALRDRHGLGVRFLMHGDGAALGRVREAGFPVEALPVGADEAECLRAEVSRLSPLALLADVRTGLARETLEAVRESGVHVTVLDDASDRRLAADLVVMPPVPQAAALSWPEGRPRLLMAWEYVPMPQTDEDAVPARGWRRPKAGEGLRVLVTMGGSDPKEWTVPVAAALKRARRALGRPPRLVVAVGPSFARKDEVGRRLVELDPSTEVLRAPPSLAPFMAGADLAVSAFGQTAYELARAGVPALYLCATADHARSAEAFVAAGMGVSCGLFDARAPKGVVEAYVGLVRDEGARAGMAARGRALLDGLGAQRIASEISSALGREIPVRATA